MGSIWKIPNSKWKSGFASNRPNEQLHPAIVEKLKNDKVSATIIPGTSKNYNIGSCVYKVDLNSNGRMSYFLIDLSMPMMIEELIKLDRGWDQIEDLNEKQLKEFALQVKLCKGYEIKINT